MKSQKGFYLLGALLLCLLFVSGCTKKETSPIPAAGTHATTKAGKSDVFKQTAANLAQECARIPTGCTCFLDGQQTTCAIVFACLDAGWCELKSLS